MVDHVDRRVASWDSPMLVFVPKLSCISCVIPECDMSLSILILRRLTVKEEALSSDVASFPTVIARRCRVLVVWWSCGLIISTF